MASRRDPSLSAVEAMKGFVAGDLVLVTEQVGAHGPMRVFWRGKSNERNPAQELAGFFATLLDTARQRHAPLEFHFGAIDYVNSSTLTALVQFIEQCRGAAVRLTIVYDRERKWQRMSFDALRVLEKDDGLLELRPL
jgi:hypothetical protein